MSIINTERFVELFCNRDSTLLNNIREAAHITWNTSYNREAALTVLDQLRRRVSQYGCLGGKALRPWVVDNQVYASLDRSEPWWGFEFETGYIDQAARSEVVEHVWDTWDNMCFDSEGEGDWRVEITFTPCEMSKYMDGTAPGLQFMRYLSDNRRLTNRTSGVMVGTHLNVSHPKMTTANYNDICDGMIATVATIPNEIDGIGNTRAFMFGRATLYGGFYSQNTGTAVWLEGKLFRTTYDFSVFQRYIRVSQALTDALNAIADAYESKANGEDSWRKAVYHRPYVANLYEMAFEDAAPRICWYNSQEISLTAINGQYGSDTWVNPTPQTYEEHRELLAQLEEIRLRKEELERERSQRRANAYTRLLERRAMHAAGDRPAYVPPEGDQENESMWCNECQDWHYEGDDSELFDDPLHIYNITADAA